MIVFVWILNMVISYFNAWGCGKTWNESKHAGGFPHLMNWMGAIMSAAGFTWCYLLVAAWLGSTIPLSEQDDGTYAPYLDPEALQALISLGYLAVILPILGSGLAITVHSWGVFWRRKTWGNAAITGYNTLAQVYNVVNAFQYVPKAWGNVGSFFGNSDKSKDQKGVLLIILVVAIVGGILTTRWIIRSTAEKTALSRAYKYKALEALEA